MMAFPFHQQNNTLSQLCDDDEFGEFTSAVSFSDGVAVKTSVHSVLPVGVQGPTFQPFTLQSPAQKITSNFVPNGDVYYNPIHDSEDEFGEFCGPAQIEQPSQTNNLVSKCVELDTPKLQIITNSDQINNGVIQNQNSSYKCQPNYNIDLDADLVPTQLTWNMSSASDDFGEFTSADAKSEKEVENSLTVEVSQNWSDDSLLWQSQPVIKDSDAISIVSLNLPSVLDTPSLLSDSMVKDLSTNSDDEFGDFAQASLPSLCYEELKIEQSTNVDERGCLNQSSSEIDLVNSKPLANCSSPTSNQNTQHLELITIPKGIDISVEDSKLDATDEEFQILQINLPAKENCNDWTESVLDASVDPLSSSRVALSEELSGDLVMCDNAAMKSDNDEEWSAFNDVETKIPNEQDETGWCDREESTGDRSQSLSDSSDFQGEEFTQFQAAKTDEADDDDEFDDFEAAPPPTVQMESPDSDIGSSEFKIQQLLNVVFPLDNTSKSASETVPPSLLSLCGSARGALWSYVKELESTPALSFQWKHSLAYQCLLRALKIDSRQVNMIMVPKWGTTTSASPVSVQPVTVASESIPETSSAPVGLDLDFFLKQKSSSSHSSSQLNTRSDSLLETIEKELLSIEPSKPAVGSTVKATSVGVKSGVFSNSSGEGKTSTVQQLADLFDTLKFAPSAETSREKGLDLLQ